VQIWDVSAQKILRSRALPDHVNACAVSPDGRLLRKRSAPQADPGQLR
jgi:hypothetical protein